MLAQKLGQFCTGNISIFLYFFAANCQKSFFKFVGIDEVGGLLNDSPKANHPLLVSATCRRNVAINMPIDTLSEYPFSTSAADIKARI